MYVIISRPGLLSREILDSREREREREAGGGGEKRNAGGEETEEEEVEQAARLEKRRSKKRDHTGQVRSVESVCAAVELRRPIRKCLLLEVGERGSFETGRSGYSVQRRAET